MTKEPIKYDVEGTGSSGALVSVLARSDRGFWVQYSFAWRLKSGTCDRFDGHCQVFGFRLGLVRSEIELPLSFVGVDVVTAAAAAAGR